MDLRDQVLHVERFPLVDTLDWFALCPIPKVTRRIELKTLRLGILHHRADHGPRLDLIVDQERIQQGVQGGPEA